MLFKKSLSAQLKNALDSYIRQNYESPLEEAVCREAVSDFAPQAYSAPERPAPKLSAPRAAKRAEKSVYSAPSYCGARETTAAPSASMPDNLESALKHLDESFQEMLLRKIDESGMRDSACYKRAGIDRKLFSKIRSNPAYKPKKTTAVAFCMALELSFDEAQELLRKAGYTLSRSSKFDVIVSFFLTHRRYDIHELNLALYEYDQPII